MAIPQTEKFLPGIGWLIQSPIDVPDDESWLGSGERSTLAGLRFSKRRDDWRLGRWTAKRAIQAADPRNMGIDLSAIEICAASDGAPEAFLNGSPAMLSLSLSHSHGAGFCVLGPKDLALGCDLEFIEPRTLEFIEDYFTAAERESLTTVDADGRAAKATLLWSAKESALKLLREGLRCDTRDVEISYEERKSGAWDSWTGNCIYEERILFGWWRPWNGYIQTIATGRPAAPPHEIVFQPLKKPEA